MFKFVFRGKKTGEKIFRSVQLITRWVLKTEQHSFPLNRYANVDSFKLKIGAFCRPYLSKFEYVFSR